MTEHCRIKADTMKTPSKFELMYDTTQQQSLRTPSCSSWPSVIPIPERLPRSGMRPSNRSSRFQAIAISPQQYGCTPTPISSASISTFSH